MTNSSPNNLKHLIRHRNKWQVKFIIPPDVRWAFDNKVTYKRSTGCDLDDIETAKSERDKIVFKFKTLVRGYRSGGKKELEALNVKYAKEQMELKRALEYVNNDSILETPGPIEQSKEKVVERLDKPGTEFEQKSYVGENEHGFNVRTWINERLLDKPREIGILKHDFWLNTEKEASKEDKS